MNSMTFEPRWSLNREANLIRLDSLIRDPRWSVIRVILDPRDPWSLICFWFLIRDPLIRCTEVSPFCLETTSFCLKLVKNTNVFKSFEKLAHRSFPILSWNYLILSWNWSKTPTFSNPLRKWRTEVSPFCLETTSFCLETGKKHQRFQILWENSAQKFPHFVLKLPNLSWNWSKTPTFSNPLRK